MNGDPYLQVDVTSLVSTVRAKASVRGAYAVLPISIQRAGFSTADHFSCFQATS